MAAGHDEQPETFRYTVVIWATSEGYHTLIPAFQIALPAAPSVEAAQAATRAYITDQAGTADFSGLELPSDVEVIVQTIETAADEQLRMPAELFAAALNAAVGDVITAVSNDREAVAVLLDVLTGVAALLRPDDATSFAPPTLWSETDLHETVREILNERIKASDLAQDERSRLPDRMRAALERQFAIARDLDLA